MGRRLSVLVSCLAVAAAVMGSVAVAYIGPRTLNLGLVVAVVAAGVVSGLLGGLAILGARPAKATLAAPIPVLTAAASAVGWTSVGGAIALAAIRRAADAQLVGICPIDSATCGHDPGSVLPLTIAIVVGAILYLVAATLYGFAGQAQGVRVGARTGRLVLLLLLCVPFASVLGGIGFVVLSIRDARESVNA